MHQTVNWQPIEQHIATYINQPFQIESHYSVAGGCINQSYRIEGAEPLTADEPPHSSTKRSFFVKLNESRYLDMYEAEAAGLTELAQPGVLDVPMPICWGITPQHAYLVMEALTLRSDNKRASTELGQRLATLHQVTQAQFGWHRDNYLGSTVQINNHQDHWVDFWREQRLRYQLQLAEQNGYCGSILQGSGERLCEELDGFFTDYQPVASLLHGDLWAGNHGVNAEGQPVIFDPAVYYGDREVDLAMTELFGGFSDDFYAAYNERYPLDAGYKVRKNLYNLYQILNHLNLFGGSYLTRAERLLSQLLSELRGD